MAKKDMTCLSNKLRNLELFLKKQHGKEVGYNKALRDAIVSMDTFMEVEVLKSLGDLHLEKAKLSKDSAEFDKAAGLYAAALLRCTGPDMGETLEHRIGYMEKLSRQLLRGYSPHYQRLSPDYTTNNVLRVAKIFNRLDMGKFLKSIEESYTETLVTAFVNDDEFLEVEALKSLGDLYAKKGQKTSDVSQVSKASTMYSKALARCGDPETRQTLQHRVLYMVKIWGAVKKKQSSSTKSSTRKRRQTTEHHLNPKRADLDSAEQHFASALKMVHVRDPTAQQYQREVEPLYKLGDVYSKQGQQTGDGGDFVKAAALYNAAIARSEDQVLNDNIVQAIKEVERSFLKCIFKDSSCNISHGNTKNHKKQLKEIRDQIKLEMETIDQQLDPYVHDEDDPCVREIEAKRAQAVRQLFEKIAQQRKELISLLLDECIGLMGPPSCKYALIGLGSQATGLVTPYSDLEFAILVEEESKECLEYFRHVTHHLHLKVVNLGETILPALGIKSLNDFYSDDPLDSWYYDSVTPRGFAFDGSMPKASKTPLGRQGTKNKPPSELICTPGNMVSKLQTDVTLYLKEGYHLGSILRNPCLIAGDQDLLDMYKSTTVKILQEDGGKVAQQLAQETLKENIKRNGDKETNTARLIDVKKEIYRFPAVAVDCLALSSGIIPTTVWETIEEMENQQVISPNNAHHLTVLTSISAELRLKTYMANGGQRENLSALASMETKATEHGKEVSIQANNKEDTALKPVFYIQNQAQLLRYYFTATPLKRMLSKPLDNSPSNFYDNSPSVQGKMYRELCKYRLAISCYDEALKKAEDKKDRMYLLWELGSAYLDTGDYQKAISYYEQAQQIHKRIFGKLTKLFPSSLGIGTLINGLGLAYTGMGDYRKAIGYLEQSLNMERNDQDTSNDGIAETLNNLGEAWRHLDDYKKAIGYYEEALQMKRTIYGQNTAHNKIAILLNNLGIAWHYQGNVRKAASYFEQALQMDKSIYGHNSAHPEIAKLVQNLGEVWSALGDYRKAISYLQQALQMFRTIHGQSTPNADIALTIDNLGKTWGKLRDYRKAIRYSEQALQMYRSIYGQTVQHADIARTLNNVGHMWEGLGDSYTAISYFEQALQMFRSVYGETTAHSGIASILSNMGSAWSSIGDQKKAISYFEQALQMQISLKQTTDHPAIAELYNNLGFAWYILHNYRKAKSYFEKAIQSFRAVYGHNTAHPLIASSLWNLAKTLYDQGNNRTAISTCKEALSMARQVGHPSIKDIEMDLGLLMRK
ncbi:hypothetical protein Bbelb_219660 [Branchiostoma belcheri]|nr:hypothetical protein Bbelb_219660 [Branchiostoma belcheri]